MPYLEDNNIGYAKNIALKYLSRAPRSIREVELKLKEKDVGENAIKETINYLLGLGYLNDELFARQRVSSKTKFRLWGKNRIIQDLKQKGISEEIIKRTLDDIESSELDTAKIAIRKWLKGKIRSRQSEVRGKEKTRQKAFRHLQSKGFSTDVILAAIKEKLGEVETDEGE